MFQRFPVFSYRILLDPVVGIFDLGVEVRAYVSHVQQPNSPSHPPSDVTDGVNLVDSLGLWSDHTDTLVLTSNLKQSLLKFGNDDF